MGFPRMANPGSLPCAIPAREARLRSRNEPRGCVAPLFRACTPCLGHVRAIPISGLGSQTKEAGAGPGFQGHALARMWAETVCCNFSFNIYLMWPDPGQLSAFGGHSSIGRSKSPCGRLAAVGRSPARFLPSSGPLPGPIGPRPALGIDPGPSSRRLQSGLRSQSNVRAEIAQCEHSEESGGLLNTSGKAALGQVLPSRPPGRHVCC
jgi:hypothetical protein